MVRLPRRAGTHERCRKAVRGFTAAPLAAPFRHASIMGSVAIIDRKTAVKVFVLITTVILNIPIALTPRRTHDNMPEREILRRPEAHFVKNLRD
jgi:hypothetical protein